MSPKALSNEISALQNSTGLRSCPDLQKPSTTRLLCGTGVNTVYIGPDI